MFKSSIELEPQERVIQCEVVMQKGQGRGCERI